MPQKTEPYKGRQEAFYTSLRLYANSWGRDKTQIIELCRSKSLRHDFYVWQNRIRFLKFEKFRYRNRPASEPLFCCY